MKSVTKTGTEASEPREGENHGSCQSSKRHEQKAEGDAPTRGDWETGKSACGGAAGGWASASRCSWGKRNVQPLGKLDGPLKTQTLLWSGYPLEIRKLMFM